MQKENNKSIWILLIILALIVAITYSYNIFVNNKAPETSNLNGYFYSDTKGFALRYPDNFRINESYFYTILKQGEEDKMIEGVKFSIPFEVATGTNLSSDSYISVEKIPNPINKCDANFFLNDDSKLIQVVTIDGREFSVASSTGAGAGNRYEETIFATKAESSCIGVRYFIHSTVFENYPDGSINKFNKDELIDTFNKIRDSLILISPSSESSLSCHGNNKFLVVAKSTNGEIGTNFLVKNLASIDSDNSCKYKVESNYFEIKNNDAEYFLALTDNFLILDSGTAPYPRELIVYDLRTRKEVFSGSYSIPVQTIRDTITYWGKSNIIPTVDNCYDFNKYKSSGLGLIIENEVTLDLVTLKKEVSNNVRCSATQ